MKQNQLTTIMVKLREDKYISRNWCLRQHITRLGSRINDLIQLGWKFKNQSKTNGVNMWGKSEKGDYIYSLLSVPKGIKRL